MLYLPEIPAPKEVVKFYESYGTFKGLEVSHPSWLQLRRAAFTDPYIAILKSTGGLRNLSLVEIGCSFGDFLRLAQLCGAHVMGVDLDQGARTHLQSLAIPNRSSLQGDEKADVVCAFQLMEHLENPACLVEKISHSLADDGRLLLALPNGGEYDAAGETWIGFRVDLEHLNYFNVKTISKLLGRFNLIVEQFWLHSQPYVDRVSEHRARPTNALTKCCRIATRVLTHRLAPSVWGQGAFVMTVLARKVPGRTD